MTVYRGTWQHFLRCYVIAGIGDAKDLSRAKCNKSETSEDLGLRSIHGSFRKSAKR